jgi:hypothetical protein
MGGLVCGWCTQANSNFTNGEGEGRGEPRADAALHLQPPMSHLLSRQGGNDEGAGHSSHNYGARSAAKANLDSVGAAEACESSQALCAAKQSPCVEFEVMIPHLLRRCGHSLCAEYHTLCAEYHTLCAEYHTLCCITCCAGPCCCLGCQLLLS